MQFTTFRSSAPRATVPLRCRAGHARPVSRSAPFAASPSCSSPQPLIRCTSAETSAVVFGPEDQLDAEQKGKSTTAAKQNDSQVMDPTFWEHMPQLMEAGMPVTVHVHELNQGGLVVRVLADPQPSLEQCRGFIPLSKCVAGLARDTAAVEALVGTQLSAVIFNVNKAGRALLLREQAAPEAAKFHVDPEAFRAIQLHHVYDGVVRSVKQYGLVLALGNGVVGLLKSHHISRERHRISNHFKLGDAFKVLILDKKEERQRILLSTRVLEQTAGDMLRNRGQVAETAEEMAAAFRAKAAAREKSGKEEGKE